MFESDSAEILYSAGDDGHILKFNLLGINHSQFKGECVARFHHVYFEAITEMIIDRKGEYMYLADKMREVKKLCLHDPSSHSGSIHRQATHLEHYNGDHSPNVSDYADNDHHEDTHIRIRAKSLGPAKKAPKNSLGQPATTYADMHKARVPKIHLNDCLVRYIGGQSGEKDNYSGKQYFKNTVYKIHLHSGGMYGFVCSKDSNIWIFNFD